MLFITVCPAVQSQILHIKSFGPSVDSLPVNAIKKITFSSGQLIAELSENKTINLDLANLRFMSCSSEYANESCCQNIFDVNAFPNPVNDLLNIQIQEPGDADIRLFTSQGQLVDAPTLKYDSCHYQIDVSPLRRGCYFCAVRTASGLSTLKFVKF